MRRFRRMVLGLVGVGALLSGVALTVGVPPAAAAPVADIAELREAITEANIDPGNETIDLVAGATYEIGGDECADLQGLDDDDNVTGDLDVFATNAGDSNSPQDLTIQTPTGAPATILVTCDDPEVDNDQQRAIEVNPDTGGDLNADALVTGLGTLTLINVDIVGGHAPYDTDINGAFSVGGGVLARDANLVLENTTFNGNRAARGANGETFIFVAGRNGGHGGGVAVVGGSLVVSGSTFTNNQAGDGGDGADGGCPDGTSFPGAGGHGGLGGAILFLQDAAGASIDVDTSTFTGNQAGDGGDGGDGQPSECGGDGNGFPGRDGGSGGAGGAIFVDGLEFTIQHSLFTGNGAGDGGVGGAGTDGEDASAPVLTDDVGAQQIGPDGGDGADGQGGGGGGDGGAVAVAAQIRGAQAEPTPERLIQNSTFDSNTSGAGGNGGNGGDGGTPQGDGFPGSAGNGGLGGCGGRGRAVAETPTFTPEDEFCDLQFLDKQDIGIQQVEGALALIHDTITENGGGGAGGAGGTPGSGTGEPIGDDGPDGGGSILTPSVEAIAIVVAESTGDTPDCWFFPLFAESNFSTDESCGFGDGSVQPFASFALSAVSDHGGPTHTRLPQAGSILRNVVAAEDCVVADDQRLFVRPTEAACEVGAVEVSAPVTLAVTKTASAASVPAGSQVTFTITVKNTGTGTPKPGVTLVETNCSKPESLTGGDANSNGTLDPNETWTYTCTANPPTVGTFSNTVTATVTNLDNLPVSGQATANVTVVAAQELARTGVNAAKWTSTGLALIAIGFALLLFGPLPGRHVRRRWRST